MNFTLDKKRRRRVERCQDAIIAGVYPRRAQLSYLYNLYYYTISGGGRKGGVFRHEAPSITLVTSRHVTLLHRLEV